MLQLKFVKINTCDQVIVLKVAVGNTSHTVDVVSIVSANSI